MIRAATASRPACAIACALALVFACMLASAVSCTQAYALDTPSTAGALMVKDGKLASAKTGKQVTLRGVSLHGLAWFGQYVNPHAFKTLRHDWKANIVRLPLYTAEYGGYCSGGDRKQLTKLVDAGVRYATENDLYVIVDWHTLSDSNPNAHVAAAKKFFSAMAKKYRAYDNVIYEICNEPNGSTSWDDVKAYARKVISTIRKRDKDAVVLVGTPEWCQRIDLAAASPLPKALARNVMYTFHFYAGTHKDDLRARLEGALDAGVPVFVSEFGICDASGTGALDKKQARKWMAMLDRFGVSRCAWNLSNKAESSAMIKPSFPKPYGFKYKNLSPSGKWVRSMLR